MRPVAVGTKRKRPKSGSGWNWRLVGIALCAFFALGVITGLSQPGRSLARRIEALLDRLPHISGSELIPTAYRVFFTREPTGRNAGTSSAASLNETIALARHPDGFYQIDGQGNLVGPVVPAATSDLPVLTGSQVEHASSRQLLEFTEELIRGEATLDTSISEMRVSADDRVRFYLDRPRFVVILDRKALALQLSRAAEVLSLWRHYQFLGIMDMTVPDEAIVRVRTQTPTVQDKANFIRGVSAKALNFDRQRAAVVATPQVVTGQ